MQKNLVETILGAVVLLVAGLFVAFFYKTTDIRPATGYELKATFSKIDGLDAGSAVRIGGVKIGSVTGLELDPKTYRAVVRFNVKSEVQIPKESDAKVASEGLLGGKFLELQPGGSDEMMAPGDEIALTQDSVSLEDLLGRFIFSATKEKDGADKTGGKKPAAEAHP